jgi:hypothetical protein
MNVSFWCTCTRLIYTAEGVVMHFLENKIESMDHIVVYLCL